jgi:hypothetical protein
VPAKASLKSSLKSSLKTESLPSFVRIQLSTPTRPLKLIIIKPEGA